MYLDCSIAAELFLLTYTISLLLVYFMQEGPHSALNEDEFFDALEMAYQQDEMVRQKKKEL